jgi:c-di-GMP-binding flagellar brake protein YcgR
MRAGPPKEAKSVKVRLRRQIRYVPPENAFAAIGRQYAKIGRLKDISRSGLAFEYISGAEVDGEEISVDVFLTNAAFHLHDVACRIVYDIDFQSLPSNDRSPESLRTRRCGVRFLVMDEVQTKMLKEFIRKHTCRK